MPWHEQGFPNLAQVIRELATRLTVMFRCTAARLVVVAALTGLAASCAASSPLRGVITGRVWPCTGAVPLPGKDVLVPVRIEQSGRVVKIRLFRAPGQFRISIPAGTYTVVPRGEVPVTVRVSSGQTVRAKLMPTQFCDSLQ
jgi:hypothetical protein